MRDINKNEPTRRPLTERYSQRNMHKPERRSHTSGTATNNKPSPHSSRPLTDEERRKIREQNIKKRRRNSKIFRTAVFGLAGVIVISLIILLLRSCSGGEENKPSDSESLSTSEMTSTSAPILTETPTTSAPGDSELLDKLWNEAMVKEADIIAAEEEKKRREEEERILANTPTEDYATEKSIKGMEIEKLGSMLIIGDSAYPYYKFNLKAAQDFAHAVNLAPSDVNVYSLIVPSKIDIELSLKVLREYPNETSDQRKAIRYINSLMGENVIKLNVYDRFKAHCDEDLFFKADSRTTPLASYYAYTLWAEKKGVNPLKLDELEEIVFENFTGSIALSSGNEALSTSDDIKIYRSNTDLSLNVKIDSTMQMWPIYTNVSDYGSSYKYSTFMAGSDNYAIITNNEIKDNSACIIVKDASGNTFAPFIAEHYHKTYVVDYRNYKGSLDKLVDESGAEDIIYYIPIENTNSSSIASEIAKLA